MGSVNIKDLARELNLSISTVSRALKDSYEISPQTKIKVFALAKQLNYQPNPNASSLRQQKTKTIAVVIPEVANNFFALVLNGIEKAAQENNYHVLIYLTHENLAREAAYLKSLINGRVDGILLSLSSETDCSKHLEEFNKSGIPLVLFDRVSDQVDNYKVTTDDFESSYMATRHLIEAGCKKIAYLRFSKNVSIGKMRFTGYLKAINEIETIENTSLVLDCSNDQDENYELIKNLLLEIKPDGIFASVEKLAISVYQLCADLNLRIPGDLRIVSFSNLDTAPLLNPSLSTIKQPAFDIGDTAARILFAKISGKSMDFPETSIIKSTLVKRQSTL